MRRVGNIFQKGCPPDVVTDRLWGRRVCAESLVSGLRLALVYSGWAALAAMALPLALRVELFKPLGPWLLSGEIPPFWPRFRPIQLDQSKRPSQSEQLAVPFWKPSTLPLALSTPGLSPAETRGSLSWALPAPTHTGSQAHLQGR